MVVFVECYILRKINKKSSFFKGFSKERLPSLSKIQKMDVQTDIRRPSLPKITLGNIDLASARKSESSLYREE